MTDAKEQRPECFGRLEKVFPQGSEGLRTTPDSCMSCIHKTDCLRTAMEGPAGFAVQEESLDRAYRSGMVRFWERWSRKKDLCRRRASCRRDASPSIQDRKSR